MRVNLSKVPSVTENLIFEHATHSISTKKFLEELKIHEKFLIKDEIKNYIDDLLRSEILALSEMDARLIREWREAN